MADTFNGWANRETWVVHLWILNELYLYRKAQRLVRRAKSEQEAIHKLRAFIEEDNPFPDGVTLMGDLIKTSLDRVEWFELFEWLKEK